MKTSPLIERHRAEGARILEEPSGAAVLTFGDVPAEYRAAREGCALFDESLRGSLGVTGADRVEFLHRILANRVKDLEAGRGNRNLLLTGKGKVVQEFDLAVEPEALRLTTHPGEAPKLAQALDLYLFNDDVQLEDQSEARASFFLTGPSAGDLLEGLLGAAPPAENRRFEEHSLLKRAWRVTRLRRPGATGWRLEGPPEGATELWQALREAGAQPAGIALSDILRCEAGEALFGVDVDDGVYPQEAGLEDAFDLDKGCYIGQEVVAKIDTYGGLNKRLLPLEVTDDEPVPRGTRLMREENGEWRDLGQVTSWAYSFVLDTGLVLGYVKRKHQELGTTFRLGEGEREATLVEAPCAATTSS